MTGAQTLMAVVLFLISALLMVVILIQKGRGGGLASAFGGGGGSGGAFGAKTGDVFTGITVVLAMVFLVLSVFSTFVFRPATFAPASTVVQPQTQTPANPVAPVSGAAPGAADTTMPVTRPLLNVVPTPTAPAPQTEEGAPSADQAEQGAASPASTETPDQSGPEKDAAEGDASNGAADG